jgi:hypothetical protein
MAITIVKDTLDDQGVSVDINGYKATRKLILHGVTGASPEAVVYNAITAAGLAALGVGIGLAHPVMTALFNYTITAKAIDIDKVELSATYQAFQSNIFPNDTQQPLLTVSSFIQSQETNEDKNGDTMVVTYTGDDDQVATATIDTCLVNLSFSRLETALPLAKQSYVDTLNSASVTWRGTTYAAKTLKITSINGTPKTDTGGYMVEYNILYNPNGWQFTAVYFKDGVVPGDVTVGDGIETFDMYPTSTFASLNLS